jgi:hypothetical protein
LQILNANKNEAWFVDGLNLGITQSLSKGAECRMQGAKNLAPREAPLAVQQASFTAKLAASANRPARAAADAVMGFPAATRRAIHRTSSKPLHHRRPL